jgi:hypothetical protein
MWVILMAVELNKTIPEQCMGCVCCMVCSIDTHPNTKECREFKAKYI